jgi:hypothetical protein
VSARQSGHSTIVRLAMYVIREIVNCKPGQVRAVVEKFQALSRALEAGGHRPLRLMTDVTGEPFWTLVAEASVETIDEFFALERKLMADESVRRAMAGFHEMVRGGRREIYRVEA